MAFLQRKRLEDKGADDRQKAILYKKVFGTDEGREVLLDLMNRNNILNPILSKGQDADRAEGARAVVCDIAMRANLDLAHFDKLLKGEI